MNKQVFIILMAIVIVVSIFFTINQQLAINSLKDQLANVTANAENAQKITSKEKERQDTTKTDVAKIKEETKSKVTMPAIQEGERLRFRTETPPLDTTSIFPKTPNFVEQQRMKLSNVKTPKLTQEQVNHPEMISSAAIVTSDLVYGNEDSRFRVVTYSDIECPYCRKMYPHLKTLVDYSKSNVSWEYKHFPLSNNNPAAAVQGAMISCAFKEKGNQWAWLMVGEMVKHTGGNGRGQGDYRLFAKHIHVEPDWLEACVHNKKYQQEVESDYREGMAMGINSTPTTILFDNETGKSKILKGFQSAEDLAKHLSVF